MRAETASANASNSSMGGFFIRSQHLGIGMFGGDLQQSAGMMFGDLGDILRAAQGQIHADARGHQDLFYARLLLRGLHQSNERPMIGRQQRADRRMQAALTAGIFRALPAGSSSSGTCWPSDRRDR